MTSTFELLPFVANARQAQVRTRIAYALTFTVCASSTSLTAQTLQQSGVSQQSQSQAVTAPPALAVKIQNVRFLRTLLGVGGGLAGVYAGGTLGYRLASDCNYSCDYDGFGGMLIGSFIGGVIGTAAGASIPQGFGNCTHGRRFKRAAVGSALGIALSFATVAAELESFALPVLVLAPPMTAAYALKRC